MGFQADVGATISGSKVLKFKFKLLVLYNRQLFVSLKCLLQQQKLKLGLIISKLPRRAFNDSDCQ